MRLPLATDLKSSIVGVMRDARLFNAHTEMRGGVQRVKKRPGAVATGWDFTTPIQGALGFGGLLYMLYGDEFALVDVGNPPIAVSIGDLVGGYYAMIDNPPTSPGPGDPYWSVSPPSSSRYIAYTRNRWTNASSVNADTIAGVVTANPYYTFGPGYDVAVIAASADAASYAAAEAWPHAFPGVTYYWTAWTVGSYVENYSVYPLNRTLWYNTEPDAVGNRVYTSRFASYQTNHIIGDPNFGVTSAANQYFEVYRVA